MKPRAGAASGSPALRVALLGFGLGGARFHAPFIATTPGLRLTAIVTSDSERRRQAEREHPGARGLESAARVWERADDYDLAVISTPNRTHVPLALAALEAGVHVVVDKPLALTAADAKRLASEAERRGRLLVPYQNRRWDGDFVTLRRLVAEGTLGRPLRFESRFDRWRPTPKPGWRERGALDEGGGLLYDLGSHLIDQALALLGPVSGVYAELDRRRPGVEVDDDVFVALAHASGARSHLHAGVMAAQPGPRFRLLGSAAAYVKHGLDVQEDALRAGEGPDRPGWGEEPEERWGRLGIGDDARTVRTERGSYGAFYAGMVAAVRDGAPPPVDARDAVAGLAVIEAARRSAVEGRVVAPAPA